MHLNFSFIVVTANLDLFDFGDNIHFWLTRTCLAIPSAEAVLLKVTQGLMIFPAQQCECPAQSLRF